MEHMRLVHSVFESIDLSAKVSAQCHEYSNTAINSIPDIARLQDRLSSFDAALRALQELLTGPSHQPQRFSRDLLESLGNCATDLRQLESRLSPSTLDTTERTTFRRLDLKWPFPGKEMEKFLSRLEHYRQKINLALLYQTTAIQNPRKGFEAIGIQLDGDASIARKRSCFCLPFKRDPDFVDRPDIMAWMADQYKIPANRMALVGMGGFGKSETAVEFAYRAREMFPGMSVFWVQASNNANFEEAYRCIADILQIPHRNDPTVNVLLLVRNWLQRKIDPWLMILDNADDVNMFYGVPGFSDDGDLARRNPDLSESRLPLESYLPRRHDGTILITTRSFTVAEKLTDGHKSIYKIPAMEPTQSLELFQSKLGVKFDVNDASELLGVLQHIPLAIAQAAAYINRQAPRASVKRYLDHFCESDEGRKGLVNSDSDKAIGESVATTWQIAFEKIRRERPSAANLLSFMSFFNPHNIPKFMLLNCGSGSLEHADENEDELEDDLNVLRGYYLVSATTRSSVYEMHSLIQSYMRAWLSRVGRVKQWKQAFFLAMVKNFPSGMRETWPICRVLLPHAKYIVDDEPSEENCQQWAVLVTNYAQYLRLIGKDADADVLSNRVVETSAAIYGVGHPSTLMSMDSLASTYMGQGRWAEAEKLLVQVMETHMLKLGEDHPDTLRSMASLVSTYMGQGRWNEAERLQVQVMEMRKMILGDDNPDTLRSMASLALIYVDQGRLREAERLQIQVMETRKMILGDDNPDTQRSMASLVSTYRRQDRWVEAPPIPESDSRIPTPDLRELLQDLPRSIHTDIVSKTRRGTEWPSSEESEDSKVHEIHRDQDNSANLGDYNPSYSTAGAESSLSLTFDREIQSKGTRPSTLPMSHPGINIQTTSHDKTVGEDPGRALAGGPGETTDGRINASEMNELETDDSDKDTTFSVDSLSDDPKLHYLQVFAGNLDQDIQASASLNVKDLESYYLDDMLKEFTWKLHGESYNSFQWETSVILHRKRRNIIDLLHSHSWYLDQIESQADQSITSDSESEKEPHDEVGDVAGNKAFRKSGAMISEWVDSVKSSSTTQENEGFDAEKPTPIEASKEQLPLLPHYEEFIRKSGAYQWLLTRICQHGQLAFDDSDVMLEIGTGIQKHLRAQEPLRKMSTRKPTALVKMTFNIDWNPLRFMQDAEIPPPFAEALPMVICLSGSWTEAQATTVIDYMDQTWPRSGRAVVSLLQKLVSVPESEECSYQVSGHDDSKQQQDIESRHSTPKGSHLTAKIQSDRCFITVVGGPHFVSELGQQIGWLSSALRRPLGAFGGTACTARLADLQVNIQTESNHRVMVVASCILAHVYQDAQTKQSDPGTCWGKLFYCPILVRGYPICRRLKRNMGLEIPLGLVSTIIGSRQAVQWGERIVIKGFNMLMVATLAAADAIVWHLLVSDNPDERISYIDGRLNDIDIRGPDRISLRMLEHRRHIIGWASKVTDFCGDATANKSLTASGLPKVPASLILDRLYIEAGSQVVAGVNITVNRKQKPSWLKRDEDYPSMLRWVSMNPIVFYDVVDRRAWLIDGASALLHLVRVSLHLEENDIESPYEWVFEAEKFKDKWAGATGRQAAIKTLKSWDNLGLNLYVTDQQRRSDGTSEKKYSTLQKRVEKILHSFEILIDRQAEEASQDGIRIAQKLDPRGDIIGFDIIDVIESHGPIFPRIKNLNSWGHGWIHYVASVGITTIFGRGFGDLILPDSNEAICPEWKCVPSGMDYMASSVATLQMLYTKGILSTEPGLGGADLTKGEMTSDIVWSSINHPFKTCNCLQQQAGGGDGGHIDPVQYLMCKTSLRTLLLRQRCTPVDLATLDEKGAVVFSHPNFLELKGSGKSASEQKDGSATEIADGSHQRRLTLPRLSSTTSQSIRSEASTGITAPSLEPSGSGEGKKRTRFRGFLGQRKKL